MLHTGTLNPFDKGMRLLKVSILQKIFK